MSISTEQHFLCILIKEVRHPTASQLHIGLWAPQQGGGAATTGAATTGAGDSCAAGA